MISKTSLSLQVAKNIGENAEKFATQNKWNVSIAIVDEAGRLIYFSKMNESTNASGDIAIAKAKHTAYYKRDTKFHEDLLLKGNNLVLSLPKSMPIEGGVLLQYNEETIGAVGVSGAASIDDGKIAKIAADTLLSLSK